MIRPGQVGFASASGCGSAYTAAAAALVMSIAERGGGGAVGAVEVLAVVHKPLQQPTLVQSSLYVGAVYALA